MLSRMNGTGLRLRPRKGAVPLGYGLKRRFVNALAAFCALLMCVPAAQAESPVTILALGDSLTAGYGLPQGDAFPVRLEAALRAQGVDVTVVNAGVSGDTSAGGRSRLDWLLGDEVDAVIVELGANDGLRGLDPAETRANLDWILARLQEKRRPALLTGMMAPPNLGADYGREFNGLYPELAQKHGALFDPFFLDGVAAKPELNQLDGIHPNAQGVAVIVARLTPLVAQLVAKAQSRAKVAKP